jgi:hypothetical protein
MDHSAIDMVGQHSMEQWPDHADTSCNGEAAIASDFNNRTRLERTTQSYSYAAHACTINWSKVEIMNIDQHSDGYSVQMHMHECGVEALASVAALPLHAAASL